MNLLPKHIALSVERLQTGRHIPEAHIRAFRMVQNHFKAGMLLESSSKKFGILEQSIDVLFESIASFRAPHEPELEDIRTTSALDVLVASVVFGVVEFVLLEEIGGVRRVATRQNAHVFGQEC